jgi:hypothetical protein
MDNDDSHWQDFEHSLLEHPWTAIVIHRQDHYPVDLLNVGNVLVVHDDDVSPVERANLCRMGFVRSDLRGGPYWMWSPPSATRPRRLGAREIPRTLEVFDSCRKQRARKVPRILRQVFGAKPGDLVLLLEPPDDVEQWDVADQWGDNDDWEQLTG